MKGDGRFLDEDESSSEEMGFFKVESSILEDALQENNKEESSIKPEDIGAVRLDKSNEKAENEEIIRESKATETSLSPENVENIANDESGLPTIKIFDKALEIPCVAKVYSMTTCVSRPIIDKVLECDCVQKMMMEVGDKIPQGCRHNFIRTVSVVDDFVCKLWDGAAQKVAFCDK